MRRLALITLFLLPATAAGFTPTPTPVKDGTRATADLPASQHKRNAAGSDSLGLCVYTSTWHAAIWQSVSDLYGFRDWMRQRPGGSYPEKFDRTLADYCREKRIPVPQYVQHTGGDDDFLRLALKTGRMVCVTYCGMDGLYKDRAGNDVVIAHMVNLVHLDDSTACIIDNNFPGQFLWMTANQFLARWRGVQENGRPYLTRDDRGRLVPIGGGWAIALLSPPPAPYPTAPGVTRAPCVCGDGCVCAAGDCPGRCPVVAPRMMVGQCGPQGCPLPKTVQIRPTVPSIPNPFGPVYPPPAVVVPQRMPAAGPGPLGTPPGPDFEWKFLPGIGWGWVQTPRPPLVQAAPADDPPVAEPDYPPNGVDCSRLSGERRYSIAGVPATKAEVEAALLADDSDHWHLSVVGDPAFLTRVRADLPAGVRAKLHIQGYSPTDWQTSQFRIPAGVTLRRPAVGRVGADLGTIPAGEYSPAKLGELLAVTGGPAAPATPAPTPRPKDGPSDKAPDRKPDDGPAAKPANPVPDHTGLLVILAALAALIVVVFRR